MNLATPWVCLMTSAPTLNASGLQQEIMQDLIALEMHVGVIASWITIRYVFLTYLTSVFLNTSEIIIKINIYEILGI